MADRAFRYENALARERLRGQGRMERPLKQRREPPKRGEVETFTAFGRVTARQFRIENLEAAARRLAQATADFTLRVELETRLAKMRDRKTTLKLWWDLSEECSELLGEVSEG